MHLILALLAGLIFGIGLIVSGMTNPAKVIGFLDLAGQWDPSLAFVMIGAIALAWAGFRLAGRRGATLLGDALHLPKVDQIDRRLVLGALTFGIGWGLAGYCPGPALASLASGGVKTLTFTVAMVAGMALFELITRLRAKPG